MLKKIIAVGTIAVATSLFSSAQAKDFAVDTPACATNFGSAYVERSASLAVYKKAGASDPAKFVEAMVVDSGCFTVTSDRNSANFIISTGLLAKKEYDSRQIPTMRSENGVSLDSLLTTEGLLSAVSSGSMRYGYLQVDERATGNLMSRGFGRNNTAGLDYSGWSTSPSQKASVSSFNTSKKARLISGAIINAYFDMGPEKASRNTYQLTGTPQFLTTAAPIGNSATPVVDSSSPTSFEPAKKDITNDVSSVTQTSTPVELSRNQQTLAGLQLGMKPDEVTAILNSAGYKPGEDQYNPLKHADKKSPSYATLLAATKETGHFGGHHGWGGSASREDTIASMKRFKNDTKEFVEVYFLPLEEGPRVSRVVYGTWATNTITPEVFSKRVETRFGEPKYKSAGMIRMNWSWDFGAEEVQLKTSGTDYRIILDDDYTRKEFREEMVARASKEAVPTETTF